ncbi:MAG TPA: cytochrome c [Terriglobales bacterium]|jgi:mono/diheme cytochrome c family protein|nr:cytochrome c [Terriglobales bacterium]
MKPDFAISRALKHLKIPALGTILLAFGMFAFSQAPAQNQNDSLRMGKKSPYAAMTEALERAKQKRNPLEGDTDAVAAGGKLYQQHCAECHGEKAGGTRRGVSLLRDEVQQATPGALFWILTNGVVRRGMPVWSKLPEPERWQIVTFLQSLTSRPLNPPSGSSQTASGGRPDSSKTRAPRVTSGGFPHPSR